MRFACLRDLELLFPPRRRLRADLSKIFCECRMRETRARLQIGTPYSIHALKKEISAVAEEKISKNALRRT